MRPNQTGSKRSALRSDGGASHDVLVCADILGAFGVTPADVRANARSDATSDRHTATDAQERQESLEWTLESALEDARNRTTLLCQTISQSGRGINCSARYATSTLSCELADAFSAVDWSIDLLERRGSLELRATDGAGGSRKATVTYPETPLEADNLPAVLARINDEILFGVDARFVLLSTGVDRWRAALIETDELERIRESYGERVSAFDRPLFPEYSLDDYETDGECDPWPEWALERERRMTEPSGQSSSDSTTVSGREAHEKTNGNTVPETSDFIDEAEPSGSERRPAETQERAPTRMESGVDSRRADSTSRPDSGDDGESTNTNTNTDLEIVGGSPTVSRVSGTVSGPETTADTLERETEGSDEKRGKKEPTGDRRADGSDTWTFQVERDRSDAAGRGRRNTDRERGRERSDDRSDSGFGTLSGPETMQTTRVSNDSFGADVEMQTEDERVKAFGAAIGTGRNISVKGLLDDEEFYPEFPTAGPSEMRIEFEEAFDPDALSRTRAAAAESGFVWVDSGSLQSTRIPNGS